MKRRIGYTCISYEQRSGTINNKEELSFYQRIIFLTLLDHLSDSSRMDQQLDSYVQERTAAAKDGARLWKAHA